ncbi:hypothetical protein niasHS_016384 [Heterodera schachtii]|uniref:BTB domain-containing protein n=1 Tax=Heterodera schachtii TaxID=97005 RepID=A0ABD2HVG9_HETSC
MSKSVIDRMKHLLSTGEYADVHFLVGDGDAKELVRAHKVILMSASEVFAAMFRFNCQKEKTENASDNCPSVEIPDVEAAAFKVMLSFIYTDDLSVLNGDNAMAVLYAAKKYIIPGLVDVSLQVPISELRNVFLAYAQAHLFELENYINDCLSYIDKNADTLLKSEAFLQIDQNLLSENCRQMLGPALFKIRFPLFSQKDFSEKIVPSGILTAEEVVGIEQYHSQSNTSGGLQYIPLQFPSHWRHLSFGTIGMDIDKLPEFAGQEVGSRRFSEKVYIRGTPWEIVAQINTKNRSTDEKWLGFYLQCEAPGEKDDNWSCECSAATFRIVWQKFGVDNATGKLFGQIFNHTAKQAGFDRCISFSELLDPYNGFSNQNVEKLTFTVDFILKDDTTDQFASSTPKTSDRTIFMEIEKISEFFCEIIGSERQSDTVHIKGVPWKIVAKINGSADEEKCLGFYLLCAVPKQAPNWSRKCSATFRIIAADRREGFFDRIFNNESRIHGFYNFATFSDLCFGWYEEQKVTLAIDIYLCYENSNSIFD